MRLLLLAASALLGTGGTQTIGGTISANSGSQITVSSTDRSLTCVVPDKYTLVILKWGTGVRVGMACSPQQGRLTLIKLTRLVTTEPPKPTTTTRPTATTPTTTEPTRPTPKPTEPTKPTTAPTPPARRDAIGIVVALAPEAVVLKRDVGGEQMVCYITPAADSQRAAKMLTIGAHVGISCRLDGTRYVLAGATSAG